MSEPEKNITKNDMPWKFCPVCGVELPKMQDLQFCINCGLDLIHVKEHEQLPPGFKKGAPIKYQYTKPSSSRVSHVKVSSRLSDEEIFGKEDRKLWGTFASIGFPILGFALVNIIPVAIVFFLVLFASDINKLADVVNNPFFSLFLIVFELILMLIPVLHTRIYFTNPSFKKSFRILGFTTKTYDRRGVLKEILLGISFAIISFFLVTIVSIATDAIFQPLFYIGGENSISHNNYAQISVSSTNVLILILTIAIMMIVVGPSEEILFRGYMQKGLVRNVGNKVGISITAGLFALFHVIFYLLAILILSILILTLGPLGIISNITDVIGSVQTNAEAFVLAVFPYLSISFLLGLLFYWRKENLIANTITHGLYNSIIAIVSLIVLVHPDADLSIFIFFAVVSAVIVGLLIYFNRTYIRIYNFFHKWIS